MTTATCAHEENIARFSFAQWRGRAERESVADRIKKLTVEITLKGRRSRSRDRRAPANSAVNPPGPAPRHDVELDVEQRGNLLISAAPEAPREIGIIRRKRRRWLAIE